MSSLKKKVVNPKAGPLRPVKKAAPAKKAAPEKKELKKAAPALKKPVKAEKGKPASAKKAVPDLHQKEVAPKKGLPIKGSPAPKLTKKGAKASKAEVSLGAEETNEDAEDEGDEIEGLASIKARFLKKGKQAGYIDQGDIMDATAHLDLSEQDLDDLITYFKDNKIDVVSDENRQGRKRSRRRRGRRGRSGGDREGRSRLHRGILEDSDRRSQSQRLGQDVP
jgi:hypothetical protein